MADHEPSGMAREDDSNDDMEEDDEDEDEDGKGGSKVKNPANVSDPTPKAKGKKVKKKVPKGTKASKKGVTPVPLSVHKALEDRKGPNDHPDKGAGGGMAKVK